VKHINPDGAATVGALNPIRLGNVVVFCATDGVHGSELWKSNGTGSGTARLKDIMSGSGGSNPQALTASRSETLVWVRPPGLMISPLAPLAFLYDDVRVTIALTAGVTLGLAAGYRGGWLDHLVMRVLDGLLAFPSVILAMTLVAVFGPSPRNLMVAIGILLTPPMARIVRSTVLAEREKDYIQAAVVAGASGLYVGLRVILPNCLSSIIVQGSLSAAAAIKVEAFLSFLGLGTNIPDASWGSLLANGYQYLNRAWWYSLFPALNIFLIVLALNVVGDGLRDALEPRLGRRLPSPRA
jgi:ELWxxDGT repeat protein